MQLGFWDLGIVLVFFLIVFFIGIRERKQINLEDYWVNSRSTKTFTFIATMLSTFVGAGTLLAGAGVAYQGGPVIFLLGLSVFCYFILFAYLLAPRIKQMGDRLQAYSLPDILAFRFSPAVRVVAGLVNLVMYAIFLAVQFIAVGSFITLITNLNFALATLLGGLILVIYTSIGGLRADIRTDVFQFFIMLLLILVFLPLLFLKGGGWQALTSLPSAYLSGTGFTSPLVWLAAFVFIGLTPIFAMDVWQRVFAAQNVRTARRGLIGAAIFTIPFFLLATAMGVFGKVLFPQISDPNLLVAHELAFVLPPGLFGLILAGFFAALMSTADSSLLIVSQTLVHDFYQTFFKKEASAEEIFRISRRVTLVLGLVALGVAVAVLSILNLTISAVSLGVVLAPAILGGFFWKRATAKGALGSIVLGAVAMFGVLGKYKEEAFIFGFLVSAISFILISLLTRHASSERALHDPGEALIR